MQEKGATILPNARRKERAKVKEEKEKGRREKAKARPPGTLRAISAEATIISKIVVKLVKRALLPSYVHSSKCRPGTELGPLADEGLNWTEQPATTFGPLADVGSELRRKVIRSTG